MALAVPGIVQYLLGPGSTWRDVGLAVAGLIVFWVCEDFTWFLINPAFGWERFNPDNSMTDAQIDEWVKTTRHKVMYRDESKID